MTTSRTAVDELIRAAGSRESIGLNEVMSEAALQSRVDRKYLLTAQELREFSLLMDSEYRILQIDNRRLFGYESVYFDSTDYTGYHSHRQGRRRRFKVRSRTYTDTGLSMFEVKTKGLRDMTVKHRLEQDQTMADHISDEAKEFLDFTIAREYGETVPELIAVMRNRYRRATFVAPAYAERVTCDVQLRFSNSTVSVAGPDAVVVETKSLNGRGVADLALRHLGIRDVQMSKYCVGMALLHPELPANKWERLLRRSFGPARVRA